MPRSLTVLTLVLGLMVVCCAASAADPAPPAPAAGKQTSARLDVQIPLQLNYLLYLPEDYDQQEAWPLVLFLHGAGERGDDLEKVKIHGPPMLVAQGRQFPFILVSPQCPKDRWWQSVELSALLDDVVRSHKVDPDRIYVTGLSMGGFGTWSLAFYSPERFAAIAPICGGGEPYWADRLAPLPTWAFHGARDNVIPLRRSEEMVEAMRRKGGRPKLTVYPDAAHNSWTPAYDDPELYDWLLAQRRTAKE